MFMVLYAPVYTAKIKMLWKVPLLQGNDFQGN